VIHRLVKREANLAPRVDQAGIDEHAELTAAETDINPILAARGRVPAGLGHWLDAPGEIVDQIEIRLGVGREDQIVFRRDFELFNESASGGKRTRSADHLTVGEGHILTDILAPDMFAKALVGSAIEG